MAEDIKLTARQQALRAIQLGESIVLDMPDGTKKQFTAANASELPQEDAFIGDDPEAKEDAQKVIQAEIDRLMAIQSRLSGVADTSKAKVEEVKSEKVISTEKAKTVNTQDVK